MCIGRTPDEALALVLDALPTALSCELVYLAIAGSTPKERAMLHGALVNDDRLATLRESLPEARDGTSAIAIPNSEPLFCLEVPLTMGKDVGRLVAGRGTPFDHEADRVLIRSAANLAGTTLQSAIVLEAAQRRDEFLAMLGHELRNPLAPILTAVELLSRNPSAEREKEIIERNTRHLARLVDDLLDISRVTQGHVELRREHVTLASILERAVEIASPLATRQGHTLTVADANGIALEGDPVRLAQIFGNLLTNAAKFTAPGGKIDVLIDRLPERVRVTVRDNGRGIPPEQCARIFEPFIQIHRERDALHGGLGLGLAIVSNLVLRHAGTIAVASEGINRGSSFIVELPTIMQVVEPAAPTQPRAMSARSGVRVLLVDDNEDIAELLSVALELEGFQTTIALTAHTALERWRSFAPHAAVLDIGLPGRDGYELARELRAEHGEKPLLIAATGYGQRSDRQAAAEAGFDCHFVKPVSVRDIVATLDEHVVSGSRGAA